TFNLTDFGAVGDYKTFDTDAFKKAVAAIAKAGGGHLIVPAGTYKTLAFQLTSHMDLHLNPGATIKGPEMLTDYGIPDPNKAPATLPSETGANGAGSGGAGFTGGFGGGPGRGRVPPLISCPANSTDISITG